MSFFRYSYYYFRSFFFVFYLSFTIWLITFLFLIFKVNYFILKIEGSKSLRFFLFLIELLSDISRPLALCIRLFVNVTVGCVICELIYYYGGLYFFRFFIFFIESFVLIIQSYIFCSLIYIYFLD
jgi:F0F1-type ATP synthase membrane subunit a